MAKFLRVAPFSGFVEKGFADESDVWLTCDYTFEGTGAGFDNNFGYIIDVSQGTGHFSSRICGVWWNGFSHNWQDDQDSGAQSSTPLPTAVGTWHTMELHIVNSGVVDCYIDGSLVFSGSESNNRDANFARFGADRSNQDVIYIDNIKIGTSRGGTQIFSEDFEGVDPLANFDATDGDLSIVTHIDFAPIVALAGPPTFEWRFAVARLDTMRILGWLPKIANQQEVMLELNKSTRASGVAPSDSPIVNLVQSDGFPILDEGVRSLLGFRRESETATKWVCRYAGIIEQVEDNVDENGGVAPYTTYTAYDPRQLLYSRRIYDADGNPPGVNGLTFTGMRGDEIVETLLERSFDNDGEHYIQLPIGAEATDVISTITFEQGTSVGEAFDQITATGNCDIIFEAYYFPTVYPTKLAQVTVYKLAGYDFDGTPNIKHKAPLAWDLPRRNLVAVNRLKDGSLRANRIQYYAEQGGNATGVESDFDSVNQYGDYWAQQSFPGSNLAAVALLASEQLLIRSKGLRTYRVTPVPGTLGQVNSPILYLDYSLGTLLPIFASNRLRHSIEVAKRVVKIPVVIRDDGSETIAGLEFGEGEEEVS